MKRLKKLTRSQKIMLSKNGIDPEGKYLRRELPNSLLLFDVVTNKLMVVEK